MCCLCNWPESLNYLIMGVKELLVTLAVIISLVEYSFEKFEII